MSNNYAGATGAIGQDNGMKQVIASYVESKYGYDLKEMKDEQGYDDAQILELLDSLAEDNDDETLESLLEGIETDSTSDDSDTSYTDDATDTIDDTETVDDTTDDTDIEDQMAEDANGPRPEFNNTDDGPEGAEGDAPGEYQPQ
ncbi:MAG: hypothetical protein RDV48_23575 [Candidatus Eremiobacteraeota bacterium]|nr:hypothetical protein [Candidatus Eremiobacteraeota bacterium]